VVGHVLEKVSLSRLLVFVDAAVQILLGTNTALGTLALQFLVGLPNSRTQELEADLVGLRLMSKACFEPGAVVECVLSSFLDVIKSCNSFDSNQVLEVI
jgi:predicted Zn-dependent protease